MSKTLWPKISNLKIFNIYLQNNKSLHSTGGVWVIQRIVYVTVCKFLFPFYEDFQCEAHVILEDGSSILISTASDRHGNKIYQCWVILLVLCQSTYVDKWAVSLHLHNLLCAVLVVMSH